MPLWPQMLIHPAMGTPTIALLQGNMQIKFIACSKMKLFLRRIHIINWGIHIPHYRKSFIVKVPSGIFFYSEVKYSITHGRY